MIKINLYLLKSLRVIWSFLRAVDLVINSVLGPLCPFFTFFPILLSRRFEPNLDVTLALIDFFFVFPSTRPPMMIANCGKSTFELFFFRGCQSLIFAVDDVHRTIHSEKKASSHHCFLFYLPISLIKNLNPSLLVALELKLIALSSPVAKYFPVSQVACRASNNFCLLADTSSGVLVNKTIFIM